MTTKKDNVRRPLNQQSSPKTGIDFSSTQNRIRIGGALLIVVIIAIVVLRQVGQRSGGLAIPPPAQSQIEYFPNLSQTHTIDPVNYPQIPPVGGPHYPRWQDCGIYNEPLKNELAVHSLEHGAVWITYQPGLPQKDLDLLKTITQQTDHRLLSPYLDLPSPIVVTAWGYQLKLDYADDPRLMAFIQQYEQGPTTPELGASCSGGINLPLSQIK